MHLSAELIQIVDESILISDYIFYQNVDETHFRRDSGHYSPEFGVDFVMVHLDMMAFRTPSLSEQGLFGEANLI